MARVLTVAREAIREGWQLTLAEHRPWGATWRSYPSSLQTIFALTVFRAGVSRSLSSMKTGDYAGWGRSRSLFQKVGVETGADGCMGEISLHEIFLLFGLPLDVVKFDPLPLHICQARILCAQCVDVSNDTRIPKMEECVVDDKAIVRGGVEDGEVGIFQS
jgi:hypothetical protein